MGGSLKVEMWEEGGRKLPSIRRDWRRRKDYKRQRSINKDCVFYTQFELVILNWEKPLAYGHSFQQIKHLSEMLKCEYAPLVKPHGFN